MPSITTGKYYKKVVNKMRSSVDSHIHLKALQRSLPLSLNKWQINAPKTQES